MYRDDLEAAQARVAALQHEAAVEKERADEAEAEAAELRARNLELLARVPAPPQRAPQAPMDARMRRSVIGWSLIVGGVAIILIGGRIGFGELAQGLGLIVLIVGCWLA